MLGTMMKSFVLISFPVDRLSRMAVGLSCSSRENSYVRNAQGIPRSLKNLVL